MVNTQFNVLFDLLKYSVKIAFRAYAHNIK